jgi:hypothetical protein
VHSHGAPAGPIPDPAASILPPASRFDPGARVTGFFGGQALVTRADGAHVSAWVPPHPAMLHDLVRRGAWDKAVRLCRRALSGREPPVLALL